MHNIVCRLRFIRAFILLGDCIYIPSSWVYQTNILSVENSLELKWKPEPWAPDEECSKGMTKKYLSTLSFPGEDYKAVDSTVDKEEKLLKKFERLFDKVLTQERRSFDFQQFLSSIIQDEVLLPDLQVIYLNKF